MMSTSGSYLRGVVIVACTVLASAVVTAVGIRSSQPPRAAQDLGNLAESLGSFQLD